MRAIDIIAYAAQIAAQLDAHIITVKPPTNAGQVRLGARIVALITAQDPLDGLGEFHRLSSCRKGAMRPTNVRYSLLSQKAVTGEAVAAA
jgi:hypothetical protein